MSGWAGALFVPLWSSGIVLGALSLRHGPPFAVTGLRFAMAAAVLGGLAVVLRRAWPRGTALGHAAMVGLLLQGAHYGGIYAAIAAGMPAGMAGMVVGLIPVATALGAVWVLGEPFTPRRAAASVLGVAAAALVSWDALRIGSAAVLALA
ncbi:MAG: DMT family transporter, partial [Gemmatimonadaceae bacterium]|nr:DMT family transporter [Acetobacteraceae bacterium]